MAFVPQCDPRWSEPTHLAEFVDMLERAPRGGVRGLCACPIRHYKTSTLIAAIAKWQRDDPLLRVIYMTHSIGRAQEIGKDIRDTCRRMGVRVKEGRDTILEWRNVAGGGVSCMSAQQSKLGADVDVLVWDDPFESGHEADKPEVRQQVDETIAHYTMRLSRGGSCVGVMSRWHPDDAIGRRLRRTRENWEYVHKRAIEDDPNGTGYLALNPSVRTVEEMVRIRNALAEQDPSERLWYAQWQNEPRAPSGDLFRDPVRYVSVPTWPGFRTFYGLDMSYSQSRIADFSAIAAIRAWGPKAFVLDVRRFKLEIRRIEENIRAVVAEHGRGPIFSYVSGPEVGIVREFARQGLLVTALPARYNKLVRAERTIGRWNKGDVMVPESAAWVDAFVERVKAFRGVEGDDDDEVDALVSGLDGGLHSGVTAPKLVGRPSI